MMGTADVQDLIAEHEVDLVAIRRDLHAHPQLGYEETYAGEVIVRELDRLGIPYVGGVATTGIVGWIGDSGEAVGLRADMDALPVTELTGADWASTTPGLMHACGHDGHMAILLGTARVLKTFEDRLPRPVKLVFQPAEEGGGGADRMIKAGALTDRVGPCPVRSMFGLHGMPYLKVGQFATRTGPLMARTDNFRIVITGRGGHAAMPQFTADPVPAAAQIATALQTIVSRNVDPADAAVLSITQLHAGYGEASNVIPDDAWLAGTFRTLQKPTADLILDRMTAIAEGIAAAHGCTAEVIHEPGYPATVNAPAAADLAMAVAREALGDAAVYEVPHGVMAGEDFAYYGEQVPACFGFIGTCPTDRETYPPLHHAKYDFNDAAIPVGVRLMVGFALRGGV